VGITGASGSIYGIRLLEVLRQFNVETHLIITRWGSKIIDYETDYKEDDVKALSSFYYEDENLEASLSSGSFLIEGMVVIPCSMKTIAAIHSGFSTSLLTRTADVTLKEGRKLILVPRETPLSSLHLKNMFELAMIGVTILPAMPAHYNKPKTIKELVDQLVGKVLDQFRIKHNIYQRWKS